MPSIPSSAHADATPACAALGTRIDMPDGPRAVEPLQEGALVRPRDHGPRQVV